MVLTVTILNFVIYDCWKDGNTCIIAGSLICSETIEAFESNEFVTDLDP